MKYKTFIAIRKVTIIIFVILVIILLSSLLCRKKDKRHSIRNSDNYGQATQTETQTSAPSYGNAVLAITKIDKEIFEYQKSDINSGKIDDQSDSYKKFITTSNYKLDLRCDFKKGYSYWNRIKIDFDQDGNWDEKWTYQKNGKIKREVSPDDNEKYEYTYYLKTDEWEKK